MLALTVCGCVVSNQPSHWQLPLIYLPLPEHRPSFVAGFISASLSVESANNQDGLNVQIYCQYMQTNRGTGRTVNTVWYFSHLALKVLVLMVSVVGSTCLRLLWVNSRSNVCIRNPSLFLFSRIFVSLLVIWCFPALWVLHFFVPVLSNSRKSPRHLALSPPWGFALIPNYQDGLNVQIYSQYMQTNRGTGRTFSPSSIIGTYI